MKPEEAGQALSRFRAQAESRGRPTRGDTVARPRSFDDDAAAHQGLEVPAGRRPACLTAAAELSRRRLPTLGQAADEAEPDGVGDAVEKT
jgi:hypothetical protein